MAKNAGTACKRMGDCGLGILMPLSASRQSDVHRAVKEGAELSIINRFRLARNR
jgi:hypothetical protein